MNQSTNIWLEFDFFDCYTIFFVTPELATEKMAHFFTMVTTDLELATEKTTQVLTTFSTKDM